MAATLILAKTINEANRYAKQVGLQRFTYRAVRSAGSIKGVRHAEVHILPSFLMRPDRHAILGALRWARTLEVFYVDPSDLTGEVKIDIVTDPSSFDAAIESFFDEFSDPEDPTPIPIEPQEDPGSEPVDDVLAAVRPAAKESEPEEDSSPSKRTRRRRCPVCQELFSADEIADHEASHSHVVKGPWAV